MSAFPSPHRLLTEAVLTALALAAALAAHFALLRPYIDGATHDFDFLHLYQPLARGLLESGPAFLLEERSAQAPLFSYLYPALLGAEIGAVKWANAIASGLALLVAFRIGWLLHSRLAGVAAAALFAASPLLRPFLASPITEPPFLLLNAIWLWGLAEWLLRGRRWGIAASAAALCLAALTRASLFYWLVALALVTPVLALAARGGARRLARGAAIAYVAALVPPAALIAKNLVLFGFPFFATGAGNALWLGTNPVTGGYDPSYLGLVWDSGSIARDQSQLTLEAERLLRGTARFAMREMEAGLVATLYLKKLAAFVFVTNAEPDALLLRSWRIVLLVLAVPGLLAIRNAWLRASLAGVALYHTVAHVPVLYMHRYSVGAIDLWLLIAAGIGMAALLLARDWRALAVTTLVAAAGVAVGYHLWRQGPPSPDVFRAARVAVWEGRAFTQTVGPQAARIEIPVREAPRFHPWFSHVLVLEAALGPAEAECGPLRIAYRREGERDFGAVVSRPLRTDGETRRLQVGGVPLGLNAEGVLALEIACPAPVPLHVRRIAVYTPVPGIDYRERWLREPPVLPHPLERGQTPGSDPGV